MVKENKEKKEETGKIKQHQEVKNWLQIYVCRQNGFVEQVPQ